jgi:ATP-binding cassette subfamily F protein 3
MYFSNAHFTIERGERVAFVGKNGEGKSTMVKAIMGEIDYEGTMALGHNILIGYFAQNEASLLDEEKTVFQTIDDVAVGDIRTKITGYSRSLYVWWRQLCQESQSTIRRRTNTSLYDQTVA